jgi:type IV secretion system protein TrbE
MAVQMTDILPGIDLHTLGIGAALAVPALGVGLLAQLAGSAHQLRALQNLKRYRGKDESFTDMLNYAALVDDGVVVCKSGALMAAWRYRGEDNASATKEHRETVSRILNSALLRFGSGWMIHVDAARRPAAPYPPAELSRFPDPITTAMDQERRQLFNTMGALYESEFVLTVTWFPPLLAQRRFVEMMFDDEAPAGKTGDTSGLLNQFRRDIATFEDRLSGILRLERLRGRRAVAENGRETLFCDLLSWLQYCVTGLRHPIAVPPCPMYLDSLVGGQDVFTGVTPKVGRHFVQVVSVDGFPTESFPGMLTALAELPLEYRWSTRFIFLDQTEAVAQFKKYRGKWKQKIRGFMDQVFNTSSGVVDQDAVLMTKDADAAIAETNSGFVAQGYYTSVVVLMGESRELVSSGARMVEKAINSLGFTARVESLNTMDAFMGSLPGHGNENVRRPLLNTGNLADLLPTASIWCGEATAPCPYYPPLAPALMQCVTDGFTPFWLNLHVRDNGHCAIFGPTRSGKSTLLGLIAAQFRRYQGSRVIAFDKGESLYPLTKAAGGLHYHIGGSHGLSLAFCPLQFLDTQSDRAWANEWIDTLLQLQGVISTPGQRNEIASAIEAMARTGETGLTSFCINVQNEVIREALKPYTIDGTMGHLLDADKDGLTDFDFVCFEIETLFHMGEKYCLPVLLYLFRRIEKSLDGRPTLLILDEAWIPLGHKVFAGKIREWLKSFAKKNVAVVMATQNLTDAANSGILDVIVESTATKIFLPNMYARDEDTSKLYRRMGLNSRQIDMVASAEMKRDYYYVSERGRRMVQLALGPIALSFVGATDPDSLKRVRELELDHGAAWPVAWLRERGVANAEALFSR